MLEAVKGQKRVLRSRALALSLPCAGGTDADLVAKKLALIETGVQELRSLARPGSNRTDVREERRRSLVTAMRGR